MNQINTESVICLSDQQYKRTYIWNLLILICVLIGLAVMFARNAPGGRLTAFGFANFKYYTVLSNVFCGAVSAAFLITCRKHSMEYALRSRLMISLKLMSAAAVGLTFLVILVFLGPIYGHINLYHGSNLWFHLIVPVLGITEFCTCPFGERIHFRSTLYAAVPTVVYGACYALNLLFNGIGTWPDTNDWYGFVNWGYPVGFAIFAIFILATWAFALLLRAVNQAGSKRRGRHRK